MSNDAKFVVFEYCPTCARPLTAYYRHLPRANLQHATCPFEDDQATIWLSLRGYLLNVWPGHSARPPDVPPQ